MTHRSISFSGLVGAVRASGATAFGSIAITRIGPRSWQPLARAIPRSNNENLHECGTEHDRLPAVAAMVRSVPRQSALCGKIVLLIPEVACSVTVAPGLDRPRHVRQPSCV